MENIQVIQKHAFNWSDLQSQSEYLFGLIKGDTLNAEQVDHIDGYLHHIGEQIENFESNLFDADESGSYYDQVRKVANSLNVKPSSDFLSHLNNQLSEMKLDGVDFQIKNAVDKFNSFYYSCAIYINHNGYVSFNGCGMENSATVTVLFNKSDKKKVTIEDVKRKISESNDTLLDDTSLSIRSKNCLHRHGITTISQLAKMSDSEIKSVRNFGQLSINEVKEFLVSI